MTTSLLDSDLTPMQELFCREYVKSLNGSQSAIRAGYSEHTSRQMASENLSKPYIQERIAELTSARLKRLEISADRVLAELAKIAFANAGELVEWVDGVPKMRNSDDLDADLLAAIEEVSSGPHGLKVKLHNKVASLEKLGQHLKLFTQKIDVDGTSRVVIVNDV